MSLRPHSSDDLNALSGCADGLARAFVTLSSDIAVVIDEAGIVTAVMQNEQTPMDPEAGSWVGRPWTQTVTGDTRGKIESLLADATAGAPGRRREVNHGTEPGTQLPVAYTALRLGERGPVLAVGRDLRSLAAIQQRFLDTQQALERSYWRARHGDVRLRLLYQVSSDAVATVDVARGAFIALNPAAVQLLQTEAASASGRPLALHFDARSRPAVADLLARACDSPEPLAGTARLAGSHVSVSLVATRMHAAAGRSVLLRLRQADPAADDTLAGGSALARHVDATPEGIVVTDAAGLVREANLAFVQMTQAGDIDAVLGRPLDTWLSGGGRALVRSVHTNGLAAGQRVTLVRRDSTRLPVRLAGALLADVGGGEAGFTLRPYDTDTLAADARAATLVRGIDALSGRLGDVDLAALLQEAQSLAWAHFTRTALDRHGGDVEAAARLLGVRADELASRRPPPSDPNSAPRGAPTLPPTR